MFPSLITRPPVLPTVLDGDAIDLEGHRLHILETGLTDTRATTAVWVPDLRLVVAGHKNPEHTDNPVILAETAQYLRDFDKTADDSATAADLFSAMLQLYPRRINPAVLWMSASAEKPI